jgi:hypothetical protein
MRCGEFNVFVNVRLFCFRFGQPLGKKGYLGAVGTKVGHLVGVIFVFICTISGEWVIWDIVRMRQRNAGGNEYLENGRVWFRVLRASIILWCTENNRGKSEPSYES